MLMGTILAAAAMHRGLNVTWIPSYGAEQRGGTANSTVVIADGEIASPIVDHPGYLAVLNQPSLDKFEPRTIPGGTILVNSSLVRRSLKRRDVQEHRVPASEMAEEIGDVRVANIVMLGAFSSLTGIVDQAALEEAVREATGRHPELLKLNLEALEAGAGIKA
jgi:2-oxoglutarate ferredoxin oxidoreductase subunit gamma